MNVKPKINYTNSILRTQNARTQSSRLAVISALACLIPLLLCGCGPDKGRDTREYDAAQTTTQSAPKPLLSDDPSASPVASDSNDPMEGSADPLSGTDPGDAPETRDPMTGNLNGSGQIRMPTVHSHWLRGIITEATVHVTANGTDLGTYSSAVDKDITMRLRKGVNLIRFDYTPNDSNGSAHLDVLESEHMPPLPPLATFKAGTRFNGDPSTVTKPGTGQTPQHVIETKAIYAN